MPKSILDPSFRYTSSVNTDIAKTFARHRKAIKAAEEKQRAEKERRATDTGNVIRHFANRKP